MTGAGDRNRTCDLTLTKRLLYQLSYPGEFGTSMRTWRENSFSVNASDCLRISPPMIDPKQENVMVVPKNTAETLRASTHLLEPLSSR